jgi:hypothetical protein
MRKIGALASGQTPSAPEAADALEALRNMYEAFVSEGLFGRQAEVWVPDGTGDFTANENRSYTVEDLASVTITLPTFVDDSWWMWQPPYGWYPSAGMSTDPCAGKRPPLDGNVIRMADLTTTERRLFVYDGATARWTSLLDLELTDEAPLSTRYGAGLQAMLGVQMSGEYGVQVPPSTAIEAARCRSAMSHRLDGPRRIVPGVYF